MFGKLALSFGVSYALLQLQFLPGQALYFFWDQISDTIETSSHHVTVNSSIGLLPEVNNNDAIPHTLHIHAHTPNTVGEVQNVAVFYVLDPNNMTRLGQLW